MASGGADPVARAARALRRKRACARGIPLRDAYLPSAVFGIAAAAGPGACLTDDRLLRHCAAQSLLRAHPRDGDHQSDRLLAVERGLNASGLRSRYPSAMHAMHIYQILNHYTSRQELDPGFRVLDNSTNERPDWFEYWPIRRFLLNEALDEDAFYGFLSPKFKLKTSLS